MAHSYLPSVHLSCNDTKQLISFAWLPPNIAESFCRNALYRETARSSHAFDIPHLGLDTTSFVADVLVEDIL